jgi:DNA polymerase-4
MGGRQAMRLCPQAIIVHPRFDAYVEASHRVFDVFHDTTPFVEGMSIDEAFLEVGGLLRLRGAPSSIAAELRAAVKERVGLPISVGVARTKHLAKIASAMAKPDGLLVVPIPDELQFLHSLPVERIWGVGPATAIKLHDAHIRTVAQIAAHDVRDLVRVVGPAAAHHLHALAHNRDPRRVRTSPARRSIGSQSALGRGPHADADLDRVLQALVDRVTRRLRTAGGTGGTVVLRLRFGDFSRSTRSHSLARPTANTGAVLDTARRLLARSLPDIHDRGCTLIGITLSGLDNHGAQLMLPFGSTSDGTVDAALDAVREKFGAKAIGPASLATARSARSAGPQPRRAPGH